MPAGYMTSTDISPRVAAYAARRLLERGKPNNFLGQVCDVKELPTKSTKTIIFRGFTKLAVATTPLQESVTPSGNTRTKRDVPCTIQQFGDWIGHTDVIEDTMEDPILADNVDALADQAAETWDVLRAGVFSAGSNVLFSNGTARSSVNTVVTRDLFRTATRTLKAQFAKKRTAKITAGPNIGTTPIPACYIAVCHTNLQPDLERCEGWKSVEEYASQGSLLDGEFGRLGEFRFVGDSNVAAWADSGGLAAAYGVLSTTGTAADVYPILIFGQNCVGTVPLAGKNAVEVLVNNRKATNGDELAQRGSTGWKGWTGNVILNDLWMLKIECSAKG